MPITQEMRRHRQRYLGSSDMPVILGVSPYKRTAADIYWSKVGDLPEEPEQDFLTTGNVLEGALLDWAGRELSCEVASEFCGEGCLFHVANKGPGADILACNLDGLIVGKPEAIECKYANADFAKGYGDQGSDEVPDHVVVQVQHQMYCADLERVWVAAALAGYSLTLCLYQVQRDEELIAMIAEKGRQWWIEHVVAQRPPEGAETPPIEVLKCIRREPASMIDLAQDAQELAEEMIRAKTEGKDLDERWEGLYARMVDLLGEAEAGRLPDGQVVSFKASVSRRFDAKRFRLDHPELARDYTTPSTSHTLRGPWSNRAKKGA